MTIPCFTSRLLALLHFLFRWIKKTLYSNFYHLATAKTEGKTLRMEWENMLKSVPYISSYFFGGINMSIHFRFEESTNSKIIQSDLISVHRKIKHANTPILCLLFSTWLLSLIIWFLLAWHNPIYSKIPHLPLCQCISISRKQYISSSSSSNRILPFRCNSTNRWLLLFSFIIFGGVEVYGFDVNGVNVNAVLLFM